MEEKSESGRNGKERRFIFLKSKIVNEELNIARGEIQKRI
jgi:hypothetical protein